MRKLFYAFVIIGALTFTSCTLPQMIKAAKEQKLEVAPNPLEVHKDTVNFDLAGNLPIKMLKKEPFIRSILFISMAKTNLL